MTPEQGRERQWRAARRAAARRHHPDVGGSVEDYVRALAAVDAAFGQGSSRRPRPTPSSVISVRASFLRRSRRTARRGLTRLLRRVRRRTYVDVT